jgi:hypothetical protein
VKLTWWHRSLISPLAWLAARQAELHGAKAQTKRVGSHGDSVHAGR